MSLETAHDGIMHLLKRLIHITHHILIRAINLLLNRFHLLMNRIATCSALRLNAVQLLSDE